MNKTVRESRHIWVGNLPENVREEQIQDYFSRFGRVEKVKLLTKSSPDGGKAAFVDFLDIRSATKANEAQNRMGDRDLRTNYNEPGVNKVQDFGRVQVGVRNNYGNYTPGIPYRGQPVVIYAAPPGNHIIRTATSYPQHQRDDRKIIYQPRRGRSPVSRASASDDDHSLSPARRLRGTVDYSTDSDASAGKFNKRSTICVQNLVTRNSDSSLEESLYYEFKKYGAILNIVIKGTGAERFAYIKFMKPEAADEALHNSGKSFLGQEMKISMKGIGSKRRASRGVDESTFDPHATRTVFIGNLEKTTMHGELRGIFESFGDVVDVDIKKMQTGLTTYAFIQYIDINSAMRAKRKMDRQYIGLNRLKVGYGRGTPTNSLWVGGLSSGVTEHQISKAFHQFGYVQRCLIDKQYWQALVRFETIEAGTRAFAEMHGKQLLGKRLLVDYASPSCRDGFYARMESNGLLDRRQLEPSPTPPDAHINFQNTARNGGRFQPRGSFSRPSFGANISPQDNNRDDYNDHHRYPVHVKNEYEKDLREYGAARDKYRSRREHSIMSRDSLSPKRRRSRESVSPVSSTSFYSDRKIKIKKEKKRKRTVDESPPPPLDEPLKKKDKKKKKERKEKWKKEKIVKGSIDLGYNMNEDEDELTKKNTPAVDGEVPMLKPKIESKKEKKERKKMEKAEKFRKKAEKRQKKLQKRKSIDESSNNVDFISEAADNKNSIVKLDLKIESGIENTIVDDKTNIPIINSNTQNTVASTNYTPLEKSDIKDTNTTESNITSNTVVTANGAIASVNVKLEPNVEEAVADEPKTNAKDTSTEKNTPKENAIPKLNGATIENIKVEKDAVVSVDTNILNSNHPPHDNITNPEKTAEKKQSNKKRKPTSEKEKKDKLRNNSENKESSDSSTSSSSSSSESEDSDESSDEEEDVKDIKLRPYRQSNKDSRINENISSHELEKKINDVKSREPKAYRQGTVSSEYQLRDGRRGHGKSKYSTSDSRKSPQPNMASKYSLSDSHKSPQPNLVCRRPASACGKLSGRNNSPNVRRSPIINERTRSRSPYERRRGHSPATRSKTSERKELFRNEHTQRTPPPQVPAKEVPQDIKPPIYPTKPLIMGNQSYTATPATSGTENPDTLLDLLRRFPVMWQGLLGLKNDTAAVQMHFLSGNVNLAESSLPRGAQPHDVPPPLRISQRMKLEPSQLEGVDKRILHPKEHCMLLALPCGRDPLDVHAQTRALKTGFITYLQQKQAAGIINVTSPMNKMTSFVVHIFPPCDFAQGHLARVAPDLLNSAADSGHLMVLITPL